MIATFSMDDDVALALIYTEGQERPSPETIGSSDWRLMIYPANSAGTAAVQIENVCGRYDLWAFSSSGSSALVDDAVWVAEAADCSSG